ncbi:MAG: hypothetical protein IT581_07500 [Verrucomicrobiales bacterium]|nr:hypothetical protein [Verrucomicrobiales bacterium]
MKRAHERLRASLIAGIVIHTVFCGQAIHAAQGRSGAMVDNDIVMLACIPHYFLMASFPPTWPSAALGDAYWWCVAGKLLVSLPASLLYGWIVGAVLCALRLLVRPKNAGGTPLDPQ